MSVLREVLLCIDQMTFVESFLWGTGVGTLQHCCPALMQSMRDTVRSAVLGCTYMLSYTHVGEAAGGLQEPRRLHLPAGPSLGLPFPLLLWHALLRS